ncbi:hypothetical protein AA0616_3047 [Komagataeibacter nataicola NRIC 0616]|nr:hypothetical protein AA0616_3047 [Komagataeibacter nataicola NRIC 0616]
MNGMHNTRWHQECPSGRYQPLVIFGRDADHAMRGRQKLSKISVTMRFDIRSFHMMLRMHAHWT